MLKIIQQHIEYGNPSRLIYIQHVLNRSHPCTTESTHWDFIWMKGTVLISLLKLEVYKFLRSKQISLRRVYLLWYLWRLFLYCAIKWLHLNRWCHLSTFCFGDIISIGDIYYLFKLILKYSIIRWLVSSIWNSDIIS